MFLPNDSAQPITLFELGDRLVHLDGRQGTLEQIFFPPNQPASYEVRWADGTVGRIVDAEIAGIELPDVVEQLSLLDEDTDATGTGGDSDGVARWRYFGG